MTDVLNFRYVASSDTNLNQNYLGPASLEELAKYVLLHHDFPDNTSSTKFIWRYHKFSDSFFCHLWLNVMVKDNWESLLEKILDGKLLVKNRREGI